MAYKIHNAPGGRFAKKVYENALIFELRAAGFDSVRQAPIVVGYRDAVVGERYVPASLPALEFRS